MITPDNVYVGGEGAGVPGFEGLGATGLETGAVPLHADMSAATVTTKKTCFMGGV